MLWHNLDAFKLDKQLILGTLVEQLKEHRAFDRLTRSIKRILLIETDEHVASALIVRCTVELEELLELWFIEIFRHTKVLVILFVLLISLIGFISLLHYGQLLGIGLRSNGEPVR